MTSGLILAASAPPFLVDVAILIVCGALIAYIGYRLGLVPIVGFLLTGVVIGPNALGLVQSQELVDATAEVGVILLLFTIGIEFSLEKLGRIKRLIFGGGGLQVVLSTVVTMGLLRLFGVSWQAGLFTGFLVALSSTAIVLKLLGDRGQTNTEPGQVSLGILIFQDLAIIVMVMLVPMMAGAGGSATDIVLALVSAGVMIAAVLLVARRVMPSLLERVARTCSQELFLLTLIALCFGTAYLTSLAGVSVALGAFLAGLIVSESRFSEHAFGEIMPLQILFSATFFVSVGMLLDLGFLVSNLPLVVGVVVLVLLIKVLTTGVSALVLGYKLPTVAASSLMLAQVGEFSFVLERTGREMNLFPAGLAEVGSQSFIAATVLLMVLTPPLSSFGMRLGRRIKDSLDDAENRHRGVGSAKPVTQPDGPEPEPEVDVHLQNHLVIAGYGRAARRFVRVLQDARIPNVVITLSPPRAREAEEAGITIVRGDATRQNALLHAGITRAKLLCIPDDDPEFAHRVTLVARTLNPTMRILARTRYQSDAEALKHAGTDQVVTEEFETIAQLFGDVLRDYHIEAGEIEHCLSIIRDDFYQPVRESANGLLAPVGDLIVGSFDTRTVTVREGAAVVGKRLDEVAFDEHGLRVKALKRGRTHVSLPPPHLTLQVGDVLTLGGTADAFAENAEFFRTMALDDDAAAEPVRERSVEAGSSDGRSGAREEGERQQVHVYGTDWCPLTGGFRAYLKRQEIPFDFHNIEEDARAEEAVKEMNGGKIKFPMVVVGDAVMKNPAIDELDEALREAGWLPVGEA